MLTAEAGIRCIEWLNAHEAELRQHQGHWVAIHLEKGIVASSPSLSEVKRAFEVRFPGETPFLHQEPREDEGPYIL